MRSDRSPLPRTLSPLACALTAVLLIGCGGGGTTGSLVDANRKATIVFPPGRAITMAPTLTVRGAVLDPSDVLGLTVGGVAAASSDGFATWTAQVVLAQGDNTLEVLVDRGSGATQEAAVVVRREGPVPMRVEDAAVDAAAGALYIVDRGGTLIAMDLATGVRRYVPGYSTYTTVTQQFGLAVHPTTGQIYLTTSTNSMFRLLAIDPVSGATTVLSETGDGKGVAVQPFSATTFPVSLDPVAGTAFTVDTQPGTGIENRVLGIDLTTGFRTTLFEQPFGPDTDAFNDIAAVPGSGTVLLADSNAFYTLTLATGDLAPGATPGASRFDYDGVGMRAYAYDSNGIAEIDPAAGTRSLISPSAGLADDIGNLRAEGLSFEPTSGDVLAIARTPGLVRVDTSTGVRTRLYDFAITGPDTTPDDLVITGEGELVYCDASDFLIEGVDLASGARGTLSGGGIGSGPTLEAPQGIALGDAPGLVYVANADIVPNPIFEIDLATGARTVVSDAVTGTGVDTCYTIDMDRAADGTLYLSDEDDDQVVAVDPVTGDRWRVAGAGVGSGPEVISYRGLDYDDTTDTIYLCDGGTTATGSCIVTIDPVSGARSTFLDGTAYTPARDLALNDVALSADGAHMYFVDDKDGTVHHVDLATGTPSVLLDPATTAGFPLHRPKHLAEGPAAGVLFVTDINYDGIFAVDATTGESVLIVR